MSDPNFEQQRYLARSGDYRVNARTQSEAGYQSATQMGLFILKGLTALNSGAAITMVTLLTSNEHTFLCREDAKFSIVFFIAGITSALLSATAGYFQAHRLQEHGSHAYNMQEGETRLDRVKAKAGTVRAACFISAYLYIAIATTVLSAVAFFIGLYLAFYAI